MIWSEKKHVVETADDGGGTAKEFSSSEAMLLSKLNVDFPNSRKPFFLS